VLHRLAGAGRHGPAAALARQAHPRELLPYLREPGVTDEQIETMLVTNPRRYVEHTGT
jgi:predicted metal-dependent phosphotriesterase family hydrolase